MPPKPDVNGRRITMTQLFDKDTDTIGLHLKNIYKSGELEENSTTEESSVVQKERKKSKCSESEEHKNKEVQRPL